MATSEMNLTSLTEEQRLALQHFTSVTEQGLDTAVPLLQRCQWNAQIAITRFFDGDADIIEPAAEAVRPYPPQAQSNARRTATLIDGNSISPPSLSSRSRKRDGGLEEARRVVPTPESHMSQPLPFPFSILLVPFNITYAIFHRVLGTLGYVFPSLPPLLQRFWSGRALTPSRDTGRRPLNPRDTVARFMREFEEEYGVTHGTVPFHEGGYAQAFDIAKRDLKFLLIVLLSPEHDLTAPFVRDTLLSPGFVNFVKDPKNNITLWGGSVQDAEAYQVASALNVTRFPYACLICHTPSVSNMAMSKIATSAGPVTAQELVNKLRAAMQSHSQELDQIRSQRQEQQASRDLRQEQESAYERSLAQDREKARRRREKEAERETAEKEERERTERKADEARKLAQWRRWRAQSIPSEPGADVKDAVRISLRLPSGERVIRRFRPDADLEELYAFVECYDLLMNGDIVAEKETPEPEGYGHVFSFQLVSPMPRETYDLESGGSVRNRIGRSGNLIVEKIVGIDDEDVTPDEQ